MKKNTKLNQNEVQTGLSSLQGWSLGEGDLSIEKEYIFPNFKMALVFVNKAGACAEELGHHPDIVLSWGKAKVAVTTHDAGGLTQLDFLLAEKIENLV